MSLINELKRRNVIKVAITCIVVAWLVMQFADVVLNNIEAPNWIFQVILLPLGLGFPMVLVFAWAFELTPEGLKRESEVNRDQSIAPKTGRKLNFTIITVLVIALGYFAYDKFFISAIREAALVETAAKSASRLEDANEQEFDRSIAVLPIADMSPNKDQEYFTDGLSEELLNLLPKIPELKVASRSSSFLFEDKGVDILEAAKQLNVAHEWLERAYTQRDGRLTGLLTDSCLNTLHQDPRRELFLEKIKLLQYWKDKKSREAEAQA